MRAAANQAKCPICGYINNIYYISCRFTLNRYNYEYADCAFCPKFIPDQAIITASASYYSSDSNYRPIERLISQA